MDAVSNTWILRVDNVSLEFDGQPILRDVNLQLSADPQPARVGGQVVALLGPSGIGKTQLLRILAGLQAPTRGAVRVGTDQQILRAGSVGMVAQNYPLFEHRTVLGNLLMMGARARLSHKELHEKTRQMLARFGLEDRAMSYPAQLSGGQRQRVAIAQQFMTRKHFLLMDEPFSGLDPVGTDSVCDLIREVASEDPNIAIIIVTHDIMAALDVADTLWLLGRDHLPNGKPIPGARIQGAYHLRERGLTAREGRDNPPEVLALERELREQFRHL